MFLILGILLGLSQLGIVVYLYSQSGMLLHIFVLFHVFVLICVLVLIC